MKAQSFDDLYNEAEQHDDYWLAGCVQAFTEEIFVLMEREGVTRSELARRLETSPAYVTKILRGKANFTLSTMNRLARALGADLRVRLMPAESPGQDARTRLEKGERSSGRTSRRSPRLAAAPQPLGSSGT